MSIKKTTTAIVTILMITTIVLFITFFAKSSSDDKPESTNSIVVSILPLKSLVTKIIGSDYLVEVLVPPGSSPETYEPIPRQLVSLSNADLVLTTGLIDFEQELISKATEQADIKVVNLSKGIDLLSGNCDKGNHHGHYHGVDPHIWTSPKQLKIMTLNIYRAIALLHPDNEIYKVNYCKLLAELDELDIKVAKMLDSAQVKCFFIYHPAMTYYANDYCIEQVSIEQDGKEPSADRLKRLIDLARNDNINTILYQKEFNKLVVETVANDIGAVAVEIDPLAENIVQSIMDITKSLVGNRE